MTVAQKRAIITGLASEYPVKKLCAVLGLATSSYYYQPTPQQSDEQLRSQIRDLVADYPTIGYRMVKQRLARDKTDAPERTVRRLLSDIPRPHRRKRVMTTDSRHAYRRYPNLIREIEASCPDHIWVGDITWLRYKRQSVYLALVMDVYTRRVRGWQLEDMLSAKMLTVPALSVALEKGTPTIFHSDQGKQYAAHLHTTPLQAVGAAVSMSDAGKPTQNAFMERMIRTLKEEHVNHVEYDTLHDMQQQLRHYLEVEYNTRRPHSSLGYLTPQEFADSYVIEQSATAAIAPSINQPTQEVLEEIIG